MIWRAFTRPGSTWLALLCVGLLFVQPRAYGSEDGTVPFVITPPEVVERMLGIARVGPGDVLIDLGAGDGRIVIGAAQRGAQALGIEIDPTLVERAQLAAIQAGVSAQARFANQDLFVTDLTPASVITLYLLPEVNLQLRPKLLALKPGTRIVSHDWDLGDWLADETIRLHTPEKPVGLGGVSQVFLWYVPAPVAGQWQMSLSGSAIPWRLDIEQQYQRLHLVAQQNAQRLNVRGVRLWGTALRMLVFARVGENTVAHLFTGTIADGQMTGTVQVYDTHPPRTITWTAKRTP